MIQASASDIESLLKSKAPTLLLFSMENCEPCEHVKKALAASQAASEVAMVEIKYTIGDVAGRSAMLRCGVRKYPTMVFVVNGAERARRDGSALPNDISLFPAHLDQWIAEQRPRGRLGMGWLRL